MAGRSPSLAPSETSPTRPALFFAIASNSAEQVEQVLARGEALAEDRAGPDDLPALAFALGNDQLTDKTAIIKTLLMHGSDPASVGLHGSGGLSDADSGLYQRIEEAMMNPAIK